MDVVGIVALVMVFGPFFYAIKRVFDLKEKRLAAANPPRELTEGDQPQLRGRVENLEAIVCDVDYELNRRLAQVATEQSRMSALAVGQCSYEATVATEAPASPAEPSPPATPTVTQAAAGQRDPAPQAPASEVLENGQIISNRYRVERMLGRGGMGAVYLAHDEVLEGEVALKVIAPLWNSDRQELLQRFRREAAAARKISSPNVIRIHDLGETRGGMIYISMEYIAGSTLAQLLAPRGALDDSAARDIIGQICDGLGAAHLAGVVHRDLKPQNVLIGERNSVKIIDFGLAKTAMMSAMTSTGMMMGSPHYMSPEQVRGGQIDARSDIYSLGALTYHVMTGRPPFDGDNPIAIGFAHCTETPVSPRELSRKVSPALERMILAALAKAPDDRPQSPAEFREAL